MEKVIIFGIGRYFNKKKQHIISKYHISAFIDNMLKPGEQRESGIEGVYIWSPEDIHKLGNDRIMLMSVRFFDMRLQLKRLGVDDSRILFGINEKVDYDNAEKILHELNFTIGVDGDGYKLSNCGMTYSFLDEDGYKDCMRNIYWRNIDFINMLARLPVEPISRRFGNEHGTPVDRYYIENFVSNNSLYIKGDVLEIADDFYTKKYGNNCISHVLHVDGRGDKNVIKGNFETGDGIFAKTMDCIICTQTIQTIFDFKTAIFNMYRMLKAGGTLLLTVHGISHISMYDYQNWGEYWRVTPKALHRIIKESVGNVVYEISYYGNVKVATAHLWGLTVEDLEEKDFEYNDEQYPLVVTAMIKKG